MTPWLADVSLCGLRCLLHRALTTPRLTPCPLAAGGKKFECSNAGKSQCKDKPFESAKCADGLKCVRNDSSWWGCKKI